MDKRKLENRKSKNKTKKYDCTKKLRNFQHLKKTFLHFCLFSLIDRPFAKFLMDKRSLIRKLYKISDLYLNQTPIYAICGLTVRKKTKNI